VKLGITMPSRTAPFVRLREYAQMADEAGFDSAWTYEVYRNPFSILATSALAQPCSASWW
jgi:alkanesulfonate monooxygenase SsuD/methylene tetrahydromethanopterin reductase-like flavin-dependent oxidoreductase (luciferase family)